MKIVSRAPTRIGLVGGGTDINPFAAEHGGIVLSLAIDLYHRAVLTPHKKKQAVVFCLEERRNFYLREVLKYSEDKKFNLVKTVINYFRQQIRTGFNLKVVFEGVGSSGLGSSASAAVAMIGAFKQWLGIEFSRLETALLAFSLEADELGWTTGKQDQLAAVFGGLNVFYFGPGQKVAVEALELKRSKIQKLRSWTVLCFTGKTRRSTEVQKLLKEKMRHYTRERELFALKDSVYEAIRYVKQGQLLKLGRLLDEVWLNKKKANPAASNKRIDYLYSEAKKKGALGGKIMGAGRQGHMFFLCPPERQPGLKKFLKKEKAVIVDFDFDFQGLTTEIEK